MSCDSCGGNCNKSTVTKQSIKSKISDEVTWKCPECKKVLSDSELKDLDCMTKCDCGTFYYLYE